MSLNQKKQRPYRTDQKKSLTTILCTIDFDSILLHVGVIVAAIVIYICMTLVRFHSPILPNRCGRFYFLRFILKKKGKKKCKQNDMKIVIVPFRLCALPKSRIQENPFNFISIWNCTFIFGWFLRRLLSFSFCYFSSLFRTLMLMRVHCCGFSWKRRRHVLCLSVKSFQFFLLTAAYTGVEPCTYIVHGCYFFLQQRITCLCLCSFV